MRADVDQRTAALLFRIQKYAPCRAAERPEDEEQKIFYDAIVNGKPLTVLPEQAMVVTQILEAIYESAKTGRLAAASIRRHSKASSSPQMPSLQIRPLPQRPTAWTGSSYRSLYSFTSSTWATMAYTVIHGYLKDLYIKYDTSHCIYAGGDYLQEARDWGGRFMPLHVIFLNIFSNKKLVKLFAVYKSISFQKAEGAESRE